MSVDSVNPEGVPRSRYLSSDGRKLFDQVMRVIVDEAGNDMFHRADPEERQSICKHMRDEAGPDRVYNFVYANFALGGVMADGAIACANQPSQLLDGSSALDLLGEHRDELRRYTDLDQFDSIEDFLRDTLRFAFLSNLRTADMAAGPASRADVVDAAPATNPRSYSVETGGKMKSTAQKFVAMLRVMGKRNYVPGLLEPLAATGFGVLGESFVQDFESPGLVTQKEGIVAPDKPVVLWTSGADPQPYLAPEIASLLVGELRGAGRKGPSRFPAESKDVSAGCPVRLPARKGEPSGVALTNPLTMNVLSSALHLSGLLPAQEVTSNGIGTSLTVGAVPPPPGL